MVVVVLLGPEGRRIVIKVAAEAVAIDNAATRTQS